MGIFLTIVFFALLVSMHVQPSNEVDAYKKSLIARGEKLEISEVLPADVPVESNGVMLVEQAFSLFTPSGDEWTNWPPMMRMVAPGKAIVEFEQPDIRASDYTNSWDNVIAAAKEQASALELLEQAATYPAWDFDLGYTNWPNARWMFLAPLKRSAQRLTATAISDLHNGNTASATTNLCAAIVLTQRLQPERTVISQLVGIAIAAIEAPATWEFLQTTNATDAELTALQNQWQQLEFVEPMGNAMLMERAFGLTSIETMRSDPKILRRYAGFSPSASSYSSGSGDWWDDTKDYVHDSLQQVIFGGEAFMWHVSWSYTDEMQGLQADQIILETFRSIKTNAAFYPSYTNMVAQMTTLGITNFDEELIFDVPNIRRMFSASAQGLANTVRKVMAAEANKQIVITAIALKRYQLKYGRFPENLAELAPDFLSSVPIDPVDGNPLRYRRNADGTFLLYSIGEDGVDDGGNPSPVVSSTTFYWLRGRDWVWPQPATEAEIKYFYEHPPK
ncbi:MAG TPA: hypothetical protein VFV23_03990 [Verrucomicrobiae bacterium]|nr:hypothetical protein [Verrucomicrobiae bacterium]